MRIHTNTLKRSDIVIALNQEANAGRIAQSVGFKVLEDKGSRSHARAFEVQLDSDAKLDGDGRRLGNSGSYGAGENYTATYDEWGFLIAALYRADEFAVWGTVKNPMYADSYDFHHKTGFSYHQDLPGIVEPDPYPFVIGKNTVGRRGYGRDEGENRYLRLQYAEAVKRHENGQRQTGYVKYQPRTPEGARAFLKLAEAVSV